MRSVLPALLLCALVVACGDNATTPPQSVPAPRQVSADAVPQPFGESFYFKYGWDAQNGPEPILQTLLERSAGIRSAWVPDPENPGPCAVFVELTQLVIELSRPDPRMIEWGFTQDAGNVHLGGCNPIWLEYDF